MWQWTSLVLLVANAVGAVICVALASLSWAIPQERGLHFTTGEPLIWAMSVFPIAAMFFLLNLIWGVIALAKRKWRSGRLWLLTPLIWLLALSVDFAHH